MTATVEVGDWDADLDATRHALAACLAEVGWTPDIIDVDNIGTGVIVNARIPLAAAGVARLAAAVDKAEQLINERAPR